MPYSCRGAQEVKRAKAAYSGGVRFCAYQQWSSGAGSESGRRRSQDHPYRRGKQTRVRGRRRACRGNEPACRESRQQAYVRAAADGSGETVVLGVRVEQRQADDPSALGAHCGRVRHDVARPAVVGLGDDDCLRRTGRARGEHQGRRRRRRDIGWRRLISVPAQCRCGRIAADDQRALPGRELSRSIVDLGVRLGHDGHGRLGQVDLGRQLRRGCPRICRDHDRAEPCGRQPGHDEGGTIRVNEVHAIARAHPGPREDATRRATSLSNAAYDHARPGPCSGIQVRKGRSAWWQTLSCQVRLNGWLVIGLSSSGLAWSLNMSD